MDNLQRKFQKSLVFTAVLMFGVPLVYGPAAYAAKPIDLAHQHVSTLQSIASAPGIKSRNTTNVEEISRSVDFNKTLHVRVQETYSGYPVWGADAVVHIPNGNKDAKSFANVLTAAQANNSFMNGIVYEGIQADLANTPEYVFGKAQAQKALQSGLDTSLANLAAQSEVKDKLSNLIVYVDSDNKAHWAFKVSFYVTPAKANQMPVKPVYIMDAVSFKIYEKWNDIQTLEEATLDDSLGGGFGGNVKMGKMVYDGLTDHLPKLNIKHDAQGNFCYLQNNDVTVTSYKSGKVISYVCNAVDKDHDGVYWDGELDAVNDGYSPGNDALFGGAVIKDMYMKWYDVPVLTENGKPMMLSMVVHDPIDNAYWDGRKMTFGDGVSYFYPLTSLGVAAHEISHGFTQQHSNLAYSGQSGGMNEAYSDIAAQAAEFYAYGKNSWQIGPEIFKQANRALRYMDQPSKDCYGKTPGSYCSIDSATQYRSGIDVHYSSGVFNRMFYVLGTTPDWNTKRAFDVMIQANQHYWTSRSTFEQGACGVMKAAKDFNYNMTDVKNAITAVGIDVSNC